MISNFFYSKFYFLITSPAFSDFINNFNGKHSILVQIAVMKKLVLIAHSLYKNNKNFDNTLYEKRVSWNHKIIENIA